MNTVSITDAGSVYTRISKTRARKLFANGQPLYIIGCKMRPGSPFSLGMMVDPVHCAEEGQTFDAMVNNHAYYNTSHEEGYYAAFYVVTEK